MFDLESCPPALYNEDYLVQKKNQTFKGYDLSMEKLTAVFFNTFV